MNAHNIGDVDYIRYSTTERHSTSVTNVSILTYIKRKKSLVEDLNFRA